MRKLFLMVFIIACATASSKAHDKLSGPAAKNLKNTQSDDSAELQALFDKGGVINLPAGKSLNISRTLYLKKNNEIIYGNMCTITYTGTDAAIDFKPAKGNYYPVRNTVSDLSINLTSPGAVGIRWQCSYSSMHNCGVALTANNQIGFQLCGDINGTGSYYNEFENCFVQGGRQNGLKNQYGWKFTYNPSTPSRCPNTNVWIGGRVGQCEVGMYINGNGNVVEHTATEGCGVCFYFDNPDSKLGCVSNKVLYPYIESCHTAFKFGPNSIRCVAAKAYATVTPSMNEDLGSKNEYTQ